jgi:hypothetical protein
VILDTPTITPAGVAVMTVPATLLKFTLYVVPLQLPELKLTKAETHAVVQSNGLLIVLVVLQLPLVAVIVTGVPTAMPVTVFPIMVPVLLVTTDPSVALNATL